MSNPITLQELADNLAVQAESAYLRILNATSTNASSYGVGYRDALLDTRATVLAMIAAEVK